MVVRQCTKVAFQVIGWLAFLALVVWVLHAHVPDEWERAVVGASTVILAFATGLLVLATSKYVHHTGEMLKLAQRAPQLDITVSGQPPDVFLADVETEDGKQRHDDPDKDLPKRF